MADLDLSVNHVDPMISSCLQNLFFFKCRFLERVAAGSRQPPPPGLANDISVTRRKAIPEMSVHQIPIVNDFIHL